MDKWLELLTKDYNDKRHLMFVFRDGNTVFSCDGNRLNGYRNLQNDYLLQGINPTEKSEKEGLTLDYIYKEYPNNIKWVIDGYKNYLQDDFKSEFKVNVKEFKKAVKTIKDFQKQETSDIFTSLRIHAGQNELLLYGRVFGGNDVSVYVKYENTKRLSYLKIYDEIREKSDNKEQLWYRLNGELNTLEQQLNVMGEYYRLDFHPQYLLDALSGFKDKEVITVSLHEKGFIRLCNSEKFAIIMGMEK